MNWAPPAEDQDAAQSWQPPAEDKDDSLGGFAKNLGSDIVGNVKGLGSLAKGMVTHPIDTAEAIPGALVQEGKRIGGGELLKGNFANAGRTLSRAMYEKPLSTALDIAPLAGGAAGLLGKGAEVGELASKAAPAAEAVAKAAPLADDVGRTVPPTSPPINLPSEAAEAIKASAPSPEAAPVAEKAALPPEIQGIIDKAKGVIPQNVQDYASDKFKAASEMPIKMGTAGQYVQKNARGMIMKTIGAAPGQLRRLGEEKASKLADYAFDKGLVNLQTGDIGVAEKIAKLKNDSGQIVGDMRNLAAKRGATHDITDLLNQIHSKLGDKYESGMESGGKSSYIKALESVAKTPPTPNEIADTVSALFHKAKNENVAAGIRNLKAPEGPYADVARELRTANESLLSKTLDPKELNIYHNALEDYGASTQLDQLRAMKWSKDMGGRLPPGMGISRAALQKVLDVGGYRGMAQIQGNIAKWLRENPEGMTTPKELFRHYVDESVDAMDELTGGGMAHGGIVSKDDQISSYLQDEFKKKENVAR